MSFHPEYHLYPSIPLHHLLAAPAAISATLAHVLPGQMGWNPRFVRGM
jgi:hypothetical protein